MAGKYKLKTVPKTTNNITTAIINSLNALGHVATRINRTGIFDPKTNRFRRSNTKESVFDIYCCLNPSGKSLWVDVKNRDDKPSKGQLEFQRKINDAGGIAIFVSDVNEFKVWYCDNQSRIFPYEG